jgi:hypothetical protein
MKKCTLGIFGLASAILATTALTGCWTAPTQLASFPEKSTMMRNWVVTETGKGNALVEARPEGAKSESSDIKARVILVDRSYRLLTVMFEDGRTQTFKVPLPDTLEIIERGDNALVRTGAVPVTSAK